MSGGNWDGTANLPWIADDGGRAAAGYRGKAGDCVTRSVAIASGRPYAEIYALLGKGMSTQRKTKRGGPVSSARDGVYTRRLWFKRTMADLGFRWVPTMAVGQGCKVHLLAGELPAGRLVVALSKHYTAVLNGFIHDTYDPSRATLWHGADGEPAERMSHRCVYGYWIFEGGKR